MTVTWCRGGAGVAEQGGSKKPRRRHLRPQMAPRSPDPRTPGIVDSAIKILFSLIWFLPQALSEGGGRSLLVRRIELARLAQPCARLLLHQQVVLGELGLLQRLLVLRRRRLRVS